MRAFGLRVVAASMAWTAFAAAAQTVTAPPRPPGFSLVRPVAGMPPQSMHDSGEKEHKYVHPDATRDDSIPTASASSGTAAGTASSADTGGKGTGPAREMGDKGASSYFYDRGKK
ncbi:hypothetical protein [Ramlibacter sp.]|uniref:hypothetical protein n=1 Tax=Ramlibacter sp. TaxID=1917967 RepID=UPI00260189C4|nr:hypothetical protein [Ramlibacter sp.]MDB5958126.1 hypothetical protein [Ramlibacter sp.]